MKKIIATMIVAAVCASLMGCGATDLANTDNTQETSVTNEVNVSEGSNEERDYGLSQETSDLLAKWNIHPMFGKLLENTPVVGIEFLRVSTEEERAQMFGESVFYEVADGVGITFELCDDEGVGRYNYCANYVNIAEGWARGGSIRFEFLSEYISSLDYAQVTSEQMEKICTISNDRTEFHINDSSMTYADVVDSLGVSGQFYLAKESDMGAFISVQWYDAEHNQIYIIGFDPHTGVVNDCHFFFT